MLNHSKKWHYSFKWSCLELFPLDLEIQNLNKYDLDLMGHISVTALKYTCWSLALKNDRRVLAKNSLGKRGLCTFTAFLISNIYPVPQHFFPPSAERIIF